MDWITFSVVVVCLLVSAFFAASETALTGASRGSMLRLSKQGNQDADIVSSLSVRRDRLIGALLLGNNIANIGASALATGIFTAWFGPVGVNARAVPVRIFRCFLRRRCSPSSRQTRRTRLRFTRHPRCCVNTPQANR